MNHAAEQIILKDAVKTFGNTSQIDKLIEEMGEVLQALMKLKASDTHENKFHVEEELADLKIVLDQMPFIFDAENLEDWRIAKLKRLEKRIAEAKGKNVPRIATFKGEPLA